MAAMNERFSTFRLLRNLAETENSARKSAENPRKLGECLTDIFSTSAKFLRRRKAEKHKPTPKEPNARWPWRSWTRLTCWTNCGQRLKPASGKETSLSANGAADHQNKPKRRRSKRMMDSQMIRLRQSPAEVRRELMRELRSLCGTFGPEIGVQAFMTKATPEARETEARRLLRQKQGER
jgi:hypothetical protein